jgi:hypothetical protein
MPAAPVAYPYYPAPLPRRVNFSAILSGMFDVWSKNFANFFVVFLVLTLVNGLIVGLLALALLGAFGSIAGLVPGVPAAFPTANFGNLVLFAVLASLGAVIISSLVTGGMTEYAVRRFRGEAITLERALRRGFEKFPRVLGASLLLTLLAFGLVFLPLLILIPAVMSGPSASSANIAAICGSLVGFVIGGIVALYVVIAMSLNTPAIMLENTNAIEGLSRSWRLTKGHWWSLFGAFLVAAILGGLISAAITFPLGLFGNPVVTLIGSALANGIVGAWYLILAAVAYDLLVRQPAWPLPYPVPPMAPPAGIAQTPQPPGTPPAPPGP